MTCYEKWLYKYRTNAFYFYSNDMTCIYDFYSILMATKKTIKYLVKLLDIYGSLKNVENLEYLKFMTIDALNKFLV